MTSGGTEFKPGLLTFIDHEGKSTQIPAENISEITAVSLSPAEEMIELTICCRTADGIFVVKVTDCPAAFDGLARCLGRFPGFDFDWQTRLSASGQVSVYRTYSDPIV